MFATTFGMKAILQSNDGRSGAEMIVIAILEKLAKSADAHMYATLSFGLIKDKSFKGILHSMHLRLDSIAKTSVMLNNGCADVLSRRRDLPGGKAYRELRIFPRIQTADSAMEPFSKHASEIATSVKLD